MSSENEVTQEEFDVFRKMSWFRVGFGVTGAVLVSLMIVNATIRDNSIAECERSSLRANATASNWQTAADARTKDGDFNTANKYMRNLMVVRASIPMPEGWEGDPEDRGKNVDDRMQGCVEANPASFPNSIWE